MEALTVTSFPSFVGFYQNSVYLLRAETNIRYALRILDKQHKLVPSDSAYQILGSDNGFQAGCCFMQGLISYYMTQRIIHFFEMIQVQKKQST